MVIITEKVWFALIVGEIHVFSKQRPLFFSIRKELFFIVTHFRLYIKLKIFIFILFS